MARSRGGRGGSEPRARILDRQARAWKLSLAGRTQREIAAELGVSQPAVKKMLDRVAADQDADLRRQTCMHLVRHFAQHGDLYREVRDAWERSKSEKTRRRHRRVDGASADGTRTIVEAEATSREGDPRFTAQLLQILKEKRAVFALFEGRVWPPAQPSDPFEDRRRELQRMSDDELRQLMEISEARMMNPELFRDVTPGQLEHWAMLLRKWGKKGEGSE